jgi:hypothetical protein
MFSADGFHPSPTAYALAAEQLLRVLCDELGGKVDAPAVQPPSSSSASTQVLDTGHTRLSVMSRLLRGPVRDLPAQSNPPVSSD